MACLTISTFCFHFIHLFTILNSCGQSAEEWNPDNGKIDSEGSTSGFMHHQIGKSGSLIKRQQAQLSKVDFGF